MGLLRVFSSPRKLHTACLKVPQRRNGEMGTTGKDLLQPCGSCISLHLQFCHAGVPHHVTQYRHKSLNLYLPPLSLSCICPWISKNGFTATNVYTQNPGDKVHTGNNAQAVGEAKSPFHQRLFQFLCTLSKAIER